MTTSLPSLVMSRSAGATVEIKYDAVRWSQASPVGKQTYDSSKDKEATGP